MGWWGGGTGEEKERNSDHSALMCLMANYSGERRKNMWAKDEATSEPVCVETWAADAKVIFESFPEILIISFYLTIC